MKNIILFIATALTICGSNAQTRDAKYYYDLAMKQSDLNKVIENFSKAIELQPGYSAAYFYRGIAYLNNKAVPKALADFNHVLQSNPKSPEVYFYRAQANEKLNSKKAALDDYNMAIQLNPKGADAYYRRGLLQKASNHATGCADLRTAKKLGYKVPDAELADCEQKKDKK